VTAERDAAEARYGAILEAQSAPASSEAPAPWGRSPWLLVVLALLLGLLALVVVLLTR